METQKEYTLKHETTGEIVSIIANSIDSDTHKYQWSFFVLANSGLELRCVYSQRWNIISIEKL